MSIHSWENRGKRQIGEQVDRSCDNCARSVPCARYQILTEKPNRSRTVWLCAQCALPIEQVFAVKEARAEAARKARTLAFVMRPGDERLLESAKAKGKRRG